MQVLMVIVAGLSLAHSLEFTLSSDENPIFEVSEKFLSVALDCSNIEGRFADFNLSDPYLTNLVSNLAPMYFRVGGTYADRYLFEDDNNATIGASDLTFYASDYQKLYAFTQRAGVRLIYDLNSLLRNSDQTWNSENAEYMIKYSNDNQMELDWELGNEPDLYGALYQTSVDATQLAKDYVTLRGILDSYDLYKSSYLIGNDMFDVGGSEANQNYLKTFLSGAKNVIHGLTWHQYYFAGRSATEELFLSPDTFNYLSQRANVVKNIVGDDNKIWMGETSSAYNGGAFNMSDKFLGTFIWLDKLGLGATLGMDVIIRQTIFHDNYALIDNDYVPNPDYWISVLYKQLVGTKVLGLSNDGDTSNTVRLYAHCGKDSKSVVVFGFNVANAQAQVNLSGFSATSESIYVLTAESSLYSQNIRLNDEVLQVTSEGFKPDFVAVEGTNSGVLTLDPYSLGYWYYSETDVKACA